MFANNVITGLECWLDHLMQCSGRTCHALLCRVPRPSLASVFFLGFALIIAEAKGAERYIDNGDGTISDTSTGLMWSKRDVRSADVRDLERYIHDLSTGNHNDWRLPNEEEFGTIMYLEGKEGWSALFEYSAGWYIAGWVSDKGGWTKLWQYSAKTSDVYFRPVRGELKAKTTE